MLFNRQAVQNEPDATEIIMPQISLEAGFNKWSENCRGSVHLDMRQLHTRDTFIPLHRKELTEEQRKNILESYLLLKEKRDGTPKGRTVAGDNNKRDFISKEDDRSPTVATKLFLLT